MFYRAETANPPRRLRRAVPVVALAAVAFTCGLIVGANAGGSSQRELATRFVRAWTRGEYAAMYADIDAASRRRTPLSAFIAAYQHDLRTATATAALLSGQAAQQHEGLIAVPVRVHTRLFGTLSLPFTLRVLEAAGEGPRLAWSRSQAFPGLLPGELLARRTALPRRATLLARDGSVLAESPETPSAGEAGATRSAAGAGEGSGGAQAATAARTSPLGAAAGAVLGSLGPVPAAQRQALEAAGVPPGALVGISGAEAALDGRLRGSPGGVLLAGAERAGGPVRVLAYASPRAAAPVRSSISPALQRATVAALGGQYGGVVAMDPRSGEILAVAGIGLDSLQPPGSTFKMVTVTGVLSAGLASPRSSYPYATYATLDGVRLNNANGEDCGGSLELAFAVSCNSVFAPLGVRLGAARLVATAEDFGFNHAPGIAGAAESTLPPAAQIQGELDVGSTAIGQGEVLASALQMATVAATIAEGGRRPAPTFSLGEHPPAPRVVSPSVARTVRHLMIAVVREGTGTAAAIPGVTVAGKTGTAELKTTCAPGGGEGEGAGGESAGGCQGSASEASNTDAWFAAFAPALHPRIAVGVLLVKDGAGGATAAPVAREVLEAGLHSAH